MIFIFVIIVFVIVIIINTFDHWYSTACECAHPVQWGLLYVCLPCASVLSLKLKRDRGKTEKETDLSLTLRSFSRRLCFALF
jgi:hypothetical protein